MFRAAGRAFAQVIHLMRSPQRAHELDIDPGADNKSMELRFLHGSGRSPSALRLKQLLHVSPQIDRITVVGDRDPHDDHTVAITTRSVMAAMNVLAEDVDVPPADVAAGRVTRTVDDDGVTPFNRQDLLHGLFEVRVSSTPPGAPSVAIHYRHAWFYLPTMTSKADPPSCC